MTRIGTLLTVFLAGGLLVLLVVSRLWDSAGQSSEEPSRTQADTSRLSGSLTIQPAHASYEMGEPTVPATPHDERLHAESIVRATGMSTYEGAALARVAAWQAGMKADGLLDGEGSARLANTECFKKGCIVTIEYPSETVHDAFRARQQLNGGLVDVWPGSKFNCALDKVTAPPTSVWILYFDEGIDWNQVL